MTRPLSQDSLNQLFYTARTYNRYTNQPLTDETIERLYELLKWGPTAVNCLPGRFVFVRSPEAKKRLVPALLPGNVSKVEKAPATIIVAQDTRFYEFLPTLWTAYDAKAAYESDPAEAQAAAFRNSSLQGAYLIVAARSLGLDVGPMSGFYPDKVDQEFFPDGRWKSNFLINIGYGEEGGFYPRGPRLDYKETVKIL
ncbi:MAG: malonic semialdehyde reductase [Deltaproteobacteria bacterium]|jgi:3-hydroxypropanoate dehydrogenase|nr:malonic semialdehyde reductase [Deltaproteobacteria bacterium]